MRLLAKVMATCLWLAAPTGLVAAEGVEQLLGWKVAGDEQLFGEDFVATFAKVAGRFLAEGGYTQRVEGHEPPTLEAVIQKHGKASAVTEEDVIVGMNNYTPATARFRFHVYGRFALGVPLNGPQHVSWVKLLRPPK